MACVFRNSVLAAAWHAWNSRRGARLGHLFSGRFAKPTKQRSRITFDDVAGQDQAKKEVAELIEFLREPERFRRVGAEVPHGVLLMGLSGIGKTLLAKTLAGEADAPFFSTSGSEFIELFVGVGAARTRKMFEAARKAAPAVIFIDELDSIGRTRGTGPGGGHDEREQTLNQILAELDGFEEKEAVVVLAATNRPDDLAPALLRFPSMQDSTSCATKGSKPWPFFRSCWRRVPAQSETADCRKSMPLFSCREPSSCCKQVIGCRGWPHE